MGKKVLVVILIIGLSLTFSCSSKVNKKFTLGKGVNVSHWLSQSEKRGEERLNYIKKADFDTIAAAGFNHVRIPIDEVQLWDSAGNKEAEAFQLLHNAVNWAIGNNLSVIVDLHIIRSHYFNAAEKPLWTDPKEQDKLVDLWNQLSGELIKYPVDMLAYEIMNEAVADSADQWNRLLAKVVSSLRVKEPERKIVIGSNMWQGAQTFPELKVPENDTNIVLSYHFYSPMALTHHMAPWTDIAEYAGPVNYPGQIVDTAAYAQLSEKAVKAMKDYANGSFDKAKLEELMSPAIKRAAELKLPLYCGEFGVYPSIPEEISLRWYTDVCNIFNANNISYAHWCYKGDFPIVDSTGSTNKNLVHILTGK